MCTSCLVLLAPHKEKVNRQHCQWLEPTTELGLLFKVLLLFSSAFWRRFVRQSRTKHGLKQNQPQKRKSFGPDPDLCDKTSVWSTFYRMVSLFPIEASVLSLSINVFIERLAKWRYWRGHSDILVVIVESEWMNLLRVYMSAILHSPLLYLIGLCSFPGSKALKLHHCNGPAYMQLRCPFKRARWYSEVCVRVCMYVYTFDGYCLCLRTILIRGMDIQWY